MLVGCDEIKIEKLVNGIIKVQFLRNVPKEVSDIYKNLGVNSSVKKIIAFECTMTEREYQEKFVENG